MCGDLLLVVEDGPLILCGQIEGREFTDLHIAASLFMSTLEVVHVSGWAGALVDADIIRTGALHILIDHLPDSSYDTFSLDTIFFRWRWYVTDASCLVSSLR